MGWSRAISEAAVRAQARHSGKDAILAQEERCEVMASADAPLLHAGPACKIHRCQEFAPHPRSSVHEKGPAGSETRYLALTAHG